MKNVLNLRMAIQKSGRLSEDSVRLMHECGLQFDSNVGTKRLRSEATNFPIEFIFLRDDDISGYVADGVVDVGIVGENVLYEKYGSEPNEVEVIERLGFSRCQLSIAVPRSFDYKNLEDLNNKKIATSYPNLLRDFLDRKNISANIHEISGSVEVAPSVGLSDAICDLVGSGSTLVSNGLKEVETILHSQAVMVVNKKLSVERAALVDKLRFRIKAVLRAENSKYVLLNAPNEAIEKISSLLPGMKSPTVIPLATPGWSSVHSVMNENEFWERIELLREAGAEGILIVPIEKMIL